MTFDFGVVVPTSAAGSVQVLYTEGATQTLIEVPVCPLDTFLDRFVAGVLAKWNEPVPQEVVDSLKKMIEQFRYGAN